MPNLVVLTILITEITQNTLASQVIQISHDVDCKYGYVIFDQNNNQNQK